MSNNPLRRHFAKGNHVRQIPGNMHYLRMDGDAAQKKAPVLFTATNRKPYNKWHAARNRTDSLPYSRHSKRVILGAVRFGMLSAQSPFLHKPHDRYPVAKSVFPCTPLLRRFPGKASRPTLT
jgi:hypothetical protein